MTLEYYGNGILYTQEYGQTFAIELSEYLKANSTKRVVAICPSAHCGQVVVTEEKTK